MGTSILIAYATKHGSTREVAETMCNELAELGLHAETAPTAEVEDLTSYDGVIVGGSLYMGRWHGDAVRFAQRHRESLTKLPFAVFAMGPRTTDAHDVSEARAQLDRSLAKAKVREPDAVAIFGGVVDPAKVRFPLNRLPASDARDWEAIRSWATTLAEAFAFGKAAAGAADPRKGLQQTPR
jgi:menaquinone-dependent protoporphyrinogen oxidase